MGSNIFQFHARLGIGILEIVFLPPDLSQHAFASLELVYDMLVLRILSGFIYNIYC